MNNKYLYIEDRDDNRNEGLKALKRSNLDKNIIAPKNIEECEKAIMKNHFKAAIIDYKLSEWVGENKTNPIKLGNIECYNGIELSEFLVSRNRKTGIGIFSANEPALRTNLNKSSIVNIVELVSQDNVPYYDINQYLTNFIEKFHSLKIIIKPLHKFVDQIPSEIESYFAKKIYQSRNIGVYHWKAGKYAWLVGVNKDISSKYSEIEKLGSDYTNANTEAEFILGIDKEDFCISVIIDKLTNTKIDLQEIFEPSYSLNYKSNKYIFDYFIVKAFCNKYLSQKLTVAKFVESVSKIGEYAKFESQKILFKSAVSEGKTKEKIYEELTPFTSIGFQKILDIYNCRVDNIHDNVAFVKLESISCELAVRVERFSIDFLNLNNLEENSQFEYTIFKLLYGGTASHIEIL